MASGQVVTRHTIRHRGPRHLAQRPMMIYEVGCERFYGVLSDTETGYLYHLVAWIRNCTSKSKRPVNSENRCSEVRRVIASEYTDSDVRIDADMTFSILSRPSAHRLFGLPFLIEATYGASGLVDLIIRALENQTCHPETTLGWDSKGDSYVIV